MTEKLEQKAKSYYKIRWSFKEDLAPVIGGVHYLKRCPQRENAKYVAHEDNRILGLMVYNGSLLIGAAYAAWNLLK